MTQTRSPRPRTSTLLAFIVAALIVLVLGMLIGAGISEVAEQVTAAPQAQAAEQAAVLEGTDAAMDPVLAVALGEGADFTEAQAEQVLTEAQLVCEWLTAEVPMAEVTRTLMDRDGLTGEDARVFASWVAVNQC